jgi:glycosyltransferase involved in cell wall biosynthesis
MKVLFITRTYPPLVGGMEKFASDFYNNYKLIGEIDLLANSGGKKTLVLFLLKVLVTLITKSRKYDVIHLYDAVLFPLIPFIHLFSKARVSFTVNGLDIVYSSFEYQRVMPFFLRRADKIIAISKYTMLQCEARGLPKQKLESIPIGITFQEEEGCLENEKSALLAKFNIPADTKKLLTVGRLVKRKGHEWFIRNILINLPESYTYLVAGQGPEFETLKNLISQLELTGRVYLLGQVSDQEKNCLYQLADLFIMPNIKVSGDQEGFGIVLLEAGQYGVPVVASNIEGIMDVVIDGQTGRLVEERDAQGYLDAITGPPIPSATIKEALVLNFDWKNISKRYQEEFQKIVSS